MPKTTDTRNDKKKPPVTPPGSGNGRVVIDPVTRIEGHLRIEVEIRNGAVAAAWSSGMLFRGIETILKDRNPEDAWFSPAVVRGVHHARVLVGALC
jgi:hypothetical protein